MSRFAMLLKSYQGDLAYAARMVDSFDRHNVEGIPLHIVVPDADVPAFAVLAGEHVTVHPESIVGAHLIDGPLNGYAAGYINQEIVKLAFWETGLAENYWCADSDLEFVRDFTTRDFMADGGTPFTFLTEDAELRVEPKYFHEQWQVREGRLRQIQEAVGLRSDRLLTVHGHATFSTVVLRAFVERYLAPRGWDYVDALAIAPYEPSWYNFWLQADQTIPIIMREPLVKTFHDPVQYLDYALRGVDASAAARGYLAVIVNSNYSRGAGVLGLESDVRDTVARDVSAGEIARALARKAARRLPSYRN